MTGLTKNEVANILHLISYEIDRRNSEIEKHRKAIQNEQKQIAELEAMRDKLELCQ